MFPAERVAVAQAIYSILIGGALSAVIFVPVLIQQYRRYGAPSLGRMLLTFSSLVYVTAIIAYTIFPVPRLSPAHCAAHPHFYIADPTLYFRQMHRSLAGASWQRVIFGPEMMQMVLNVALFVPFGFYARRLLRRGWFTSILLGAATSLLVETTQYLEYC